MPFVVLILLVLGFVMVLLAGLGVVPNPPRPWNIGWLGLASVILAEILSRAAGYHFLG
jgi:hypothetical protein